LWAPGDPFSGEDNPPVTIDWAWEGAARVFDAFGHELAFQRDNRGLQLAVSVTPVFVSGEVKTS
jgi:hypothetical protein